MQKNLTNYCGNTGVVKNYQGNTRAENETTIHETGHMLGLSDRYTNLLGPNNTKFSVIDAKYKDDIMGGGGSKVSQNHYNNWSNWAKGKENGAYNLEKRVDIDGKGNLLPLPTKSKGQ